MNAYLQLTLAQLKLFARNRSVIFFSLLFPILLMLALGTFIGSGTQTILDTAVFDQDGTPYSRQFVDALKEQNILRINHFSDEQTALEMLRRGELNLVVVIPEGYGQTVDTNAQYGTSQQTAQVKVYFDKTNLNVSQIGITLIQQTAETINKELVGYRPWIVIQPEGVQSVQLEYIDFLVPGIVAMMIMSSNLNGVAGQIASWRERGILRRMQSTTLKSSTFIAAQITARMFINGVQALLVIIVGNLFFQTQVNGSWLLLIAFVLLGTLTFMSIGFIIAALAKTPESAAPIAGLISFPLLFLGNVFFPVKNMPEAIQPIVHSIPITHLSNALRQIMNVGAGISDLWVEAAFLGGWMIVAFAIASKAFKWE